LPSIVTGIATSISACVPDSNPSSPSVSAAIATEAPTSVRPPASSVPQRARVMNLRMMFSLC
jgi:hypothetical protein